MQQSELLPTSTFLASRLNPFCPSFSAFHPSVVVQRSLPVRVHSFEHWSCFFSLRSRLEQRHKHPDRRLKRLGALANRPSHHTGFCSFGPRVVQHLWQQQCLGFFAQLSTDTDGPRIDRASPHYGDCPDHCDQLSRYDHPYQRHSVVG